MGTTLGTSGLTFGETGKYVDAYSLKTYCGIFVAWRNSFSSHGSLNSQVCDAPQQRQSLETLLFSQASLLSATNSHHFLENN